MSALGAYLLDRTSLNPEHLAAAEALQQERDVRLGAVLLEEGWVREEEYLAAAAAFLALEYAPQIDQSVSPALLTKVPLAFLREHLMVPLREEGDRCIVGVHDPFNLHALDDLAALLGIRVEAVVYPRQEITRVIEGYFDAEQHSAAQIIQDIDESELGLEALTAERRDLLDLANEAPIIKLVNVIISQAVRERASDIHIEPYERELKVRYRIDGVLYEMHRPPRQFHASVVSRIKVMADLDIAERRMPQDGRIKITLRGVEIDIRVSIVPTAYGERVVMRILDRTHFLFSLEELGMAADDLATVERVLVLSHGIVLVTGPTGSGKTTTLYAALSRLNSSTTNIITVEDPIEYQMDGIGQIQVRPHMGLTFANGLRSILRQDPDVILVGEIRDPETAEMAIQASLTGHLVFSTLHTNDAAGGITRLTNMGIEPFLVSSSVAAIIAQRLVRTLCDACREPYAPTDEELVELGLPRDALTDGHAYRAVGCAACSNRGYLGRTGIFEILLMDSVLQDAVLSHRAATEVRRVAVADRRMRTLRGDGARKVIAGITSVEEVLRVSREVVVEA